MLYHAHTLSEVLDEFSTSEKGLHQIYAEDRLTKYGRNEIRISRQSLRHIIAAPFMNVFMLVLVVALGLSILSSQHISTALIALIISVTAVARYIQIFSLEHAHRALEYQAIGDARIRRDGIEANIDPAQIVPGDIVLLNVGDRVPADGRILHEQQLKLNELQITGEATAVVKHNKPIHSDSDLSERANMVYRGSYVTAGSGRYVVTATGNQTEYGKITSRLMRRSRRTTLQDKIDILSVRSIAVVLTIAILMLIVSLGRGMQLSEATDYAIAITVASVPAILPVAISLVIAIGLQRMAAHSALARSMQDVEAISMINTIVSDKTGMLTKHQLKVVDTWQPENATADLLASSTKAVIHTKGDTDALDDALVVYLSEHHTSTPTTQKPVTDFEFDHHVGMSGNLWHKGESYELYIKGSPEKLLHLSQLTENEHENAVHALHKLASQGYKVVAIAHTELTLPITRMEKIPKRHKLEFDGLIAFKDHLQPDAKQTIAAATKAGVTVRMVTGDHVETAYNLARQLDIVSSHNQVLDTRKLSVMSDNELSRVIKQVHVFARSTPDQKHKLLSALRRNHIVAMTGRNVDDIPALLQAHVGVSTAQSTILARDASNLILLDNKFSSILEAIKHTRTMLGNIRRMLLYLLTANIAEVGVLLGSLLLGLPPALVPAQILWINLVTSTSLVLPLGVEPHSRNIMKRRPVSPRASILPRYLVARMAILAMSMILLALVLFAHFFVVQGVAYAQTIVFHMFVVMQLVSAFSARSDHTSTLVRLRTFSPVFYLGVALALSLHTITLFTPFGQLIGLVSVSWRDILLTTALAIAIPLGVSELLKLHSRHTVRRKGESY